MSITFRDVTAQFARRPLADQEQKLHWCISASGPKSCPRSGGYILSLQYGYGSIPINTYIHTIFRGMNIHKSQLFWCELQGYYWFWHTAISWNILQQFPKALGTGRVKKHLVTASRTAWLSWFRFAWSDFGRPTVNDAIQRQGWLGTQKYLFFLLATNSGDRSKQPSIIALALILRCKIPCQERVFMWPPSCTVFHSRRVDNILRQTDVVFLDAKDERVEIEWNLIACILAKTVKCIRFSWIIYCFLARKAEKYVPSPKGPAARGTAILWKQHVKIRSTYIISSFGNLQKRSENRKGDVQAAYMQVVGWETCGSGRNDSRIPTLQHCADSCGFGYGSTPYLIFGDKHPFSSYSHAVGGGTRFCSCLAFCKQRCLAAVLLRSFLLPLMNRCSRREKDNSWHDIIYTYIIYTQ